MNLDIQKYEDLREINQRHRNELLAAFETVLDSGWFILGQEVENFEIEFAKWNGCEHSIGVASGLDALKLALRQYEFPAGSEVILPANAYIAAHLAIISAGLKPVHVEPCWETCNINPEKIEEKITNKTVAVLCVHLYGNPCEIEALNGLCSRYQLALIEDCAQAHGAKVKDKKVGSFGIGCFSFYPTKNLGALGDGGLITTANSFYASKFRALRNYGSKEKYYNEYVGENSRLDEIQAAILRVKLKTLDDYLIHKINIATAYNTLLKGNIIKPKILSGNVSAWHIYNIRTSKRDQLKQYLEDHSVQTMIHYPVAPHAQPALSGIVEKCEISQRIHEETLSLPISASTSLSSAERIAGIINNFK